MTGTVKPLAGIRVVEMAGLAPAPFAGMILDFGADVIRVDRIAESNPDVLVRGKRSIAVSLKGSEGQNIVKELAMKADVLIEPFRPGVMERLNLGPNVLCNAAQGNPGLIYARMTGFGQKGPWAKRAGHDINYLALSGALALFGPSDAPPTPPANILGDFGGATFCALGILLALLTRSKTGQGQVIDANIVHSSTYLTAFALLSKLSSNPINSYAWSGPRGQNLLDGGSPMYRCYETKDGKFVSVGALEPQFYAQLLRGLDLEEDKIPDRLNPEAWPELAQLFAQKIKERSRDEWTRIYATENLADACLAPVLTPEEIVPGLAGTGGAHREASVESTRLAPAPIMDGVHVDHYRPLHEAPELVPGTHTVPILKELGYGDKAIRHLIQKAAVQSLELLSKL